jgi:AcrR family transcriptional regulator
MVQAAQLGRRERSRRLRHRAYLGAARRLVATEGLDALTMQRLADELDAAVGTIYTYFPSKSALLAAVQRAAIERLAESYRLSRLSLDASLAGAAVEPHVAALTRLVAVGRFWVASFEVFPDEAMLLQLLMAELHPRITPSDAVEVVPVAMAMLGEAQAVIADGQRTGALADGDPMRRTVLLWAAMNGVLLTSKLQQWDEELFDGARLAEVLLHDLVTGWGARETDLTAAFAVVADHMQRAPIAPLVPDPIKEESL